ncbi:MAG: hypothetical protein GY822_11815 [Deltaproteobacteria bacterium]|nr:hypothetical protein [Deltaproteobacteria bacterium]
MIYFQKGSFRGIGLFCCCAAFVVAGCTGNSTDGGTEPTPSPNPSVSPNDDAGIAFSDGGQTKDGGLVVDEDAGSPEDAGYFDAGPHAECPTEGCDDNNPCTNDFCNAETDFYCNNAPKNNGTICTNVCQPQATCQEGICEGERISGINDYNPCTEDSCDPSILAGDPILHVPLADALCPTTNQCKESSICVLCEPDEPGCDVVKCDSEAGLERDCNDGNECTVDLCDPTAGGCQDSQILATNFCRPIILIDYPPRGATISGSASNQLIPILGSITSNLGDITSVTANGHELVLDDDGNLPVNQIGIASNWIPVDVGINVLIIEARDSRDQVHRQVQSFMWASRYTKPDSAGKSQTLANDTMGIYLGGASLDDGDHGGPPNDIATLFELGLATDFDLGTLLGNVQDISFSYGGTAYPDVFDTANVTHLPVSVSLTPVAPFGMHLTMTLRQIEIPLNLPTGLGFSASPVVTYDTIHFDTDLVVTNNICPLLVGETACSSNVLCEYEPPASSLPEKCTQVETLICPTLIGETDCLSNVLCKFRPAADGAPEKCSSLAEGKVHVAPANTFVSLGVASANTGIAEADAILENTLSIGSSYLAASFKLGFSTVLVDKVAPVIGDMFSAFNFEQTLFLPALETGGEDIEITMISTVFEEAWV